MDEIQTPTAKKQSDLISKPPKKADESSFKISERRTDSSPIKKAQIKHTEVMTSNFLSSKHSKLNAGLPPESPSKKRISNTNDSSTLILSPS